MHVLAIGAHPDDIELGCGATLAAHAAGGDTVTMLVMTNGERGPTETIPRTSEQEQSAAILGAQLYWGGFADGAIPQGREPVDVIESLLFRVGADVVYSHSPRDTHQDHRAVAEATLAATRRLPRICLYESPSTRGFSPSHYVDVDGYLDTKMKMLEAHASQILSNGFVDLDAIEAQARYRGFQARRTLAEAFEVDRFVWDVAPLPRPGEASATRSTRPLPEEEVA